MVDFQEELHVVHAELFPVHVDKSGTLLSQAFHVISKNTKNNNKTNDFKKGANVIRFLFCLILLCSPLLMIFICQVENTNGIVHRQAPNEEIRTDLLKSIQQKLVLKYRKILGPKIARFFVWF